MESHSVDQRRHKSVEKDTSSVKRQGNKGIKHDAHDAEGDLPGQGKIKQRVQERNRSIQGRVNDTGTT